MNETWRAISREAALAAEQLAIGITALGKASYARNAYYGQAFFALSIGMERSAKLALVIDHAFDNAGSFPAPSTVRDYGHDLNALLLKVDEIGLRRYPNQSNARLPSTPFHTAILTVLSDFARNITRYYNLEVITGAPRVKETTDPVQAWYETVIVPVLATHYKPTRRLADQQKAEVIGALIGEHVSVLHTSESGEQLNSFGAASFQSAQLDAARPYVRMYVMQIARFLGRVMSELGYTAYELENDTIPHLSDFFRIFNNSDKYFRERKHWSIYL